MQVQRNATAKHILNKILNAEKMTPDKLRSFPGFEEIKDEEAAHVIETLETFCGVIVKHISKREDYEEP